MNDDLASYELIRSARKSIAVEISRDLRVIVRAPAHMPRRDVDAFVLRHAQWIEKHRELQRQRTAAHPEPTVEMRQELVQRAQAVLPERVAHYAALMGVTPTALKITSARGRFGSCSGKNSICFSYLLMAYPPEAVDYVVVHELAHIVHKNHSAAFYQLIERYLPDWRARRALLKQ